MAELVRVDFRKYDGARHWQLRLRRLGEDRHGVWVGTPAGGSMRKGDEPPVVLSHAFVLLIPPEAGWVAMFNAAPYRTEIYCDLTTVPRWSAPDEVTMVDLDLDVIRLRADGSIRLLDEDEFAEHRVRYQYPAELVATTTGTAQWLRTALADGTEPFAAGYQRWLAEVA